MAFAFQLPQDGTYRLSRDEHDGRWESPRRMSAGPMVPDFDLTAALPTVARNAGRDVQPTGGIVVPRGGKFPIELSLYRSSGFEGEVQVECEGLPSGVTGSATIAAGQNNSVLFLTADDSAKAWAGGCENCCDRKTSRGVISHEAHYRTIVLPSTEEEAAPSRACSDFAFAVSEELQ